MKENPGKDQNKVVSAMGEATLAPPPLPPLTGRLTSPLFSCRARSFFGFKWRYIPEHLAVLLDKIYKFENKTYELGGEAAQAVMNSTVVKNNKRPRRVKGKLVVAVERGSAVAAHTTCYEQKTKVNGLKVTLLSPDAQSSPSLHHSFSCPLSHSLNFLSSSLCLSLHFSLTLSH